MEPCFKQHTAVDDRAGVIVDVAVTTGEASEGRQLAAQIERIESNTGKKIGIVTADGGYAHGRNYAWLESKNIKAIIPPQTVGRKSTRIPSGRFKYDGRHKRVRCPVGKTLKRSSQTKQGWMYRAKTSDCRICPLRSNCKSPTASARTIVIGDGYEALTRARRGHGQWDSTTRKLYARHRWRAEGVHGEAKTQHGLRRAARRGTWNVAIQVYLTAMVMNLKRLAAFLRTLSILYRRMMPTLRMTHRRHVTYCAHGSAKSTLTTTYRKAPKGDFFNSPTVAVLHVSVSHSLALNNHRRQLSIIHL